MTVRVKPVSALRWSRCGHARNTLINVFCVRGLNDCPSGWYCVWAAQFYGGARYQFRSQGYWQNLDDYGVPWFYSFYNRRSNRVFIAPYQGQPSKCYQAGTRVSDSTNVRHYRLIYLAESNNPC
ncbi:peptidase inhibitor family I36 protein [Spirillospora sp. NPDC047279]|uniref:peptidase inhibitor family I36 protein n=1 Tax=Spirillospora sp. NPDC047279 TaxID=3155478 RepID=UPI00340E3E82